MAKKDNSNEQLNKQDNPKKSSMVWKQEFKTDHDTIIPEDEDIVIEDVNFDLNKDNIEKAEAQVKEQRSKRGKWFSIAFFVVNIVVLVGVLIYQYNEFGVNHLGTFLVQGKNYIYLILAILTFLLIMTLETIRNYALLLKSTKMHRPILAYKSAVIHRYYDNITPLATGGQAFELIYLRSRGINGGIATSIPFAKYIINQFAFVSLSIILLITNGYVLSEGSTFIIVLAIISLSVITLAVSFIIFLSVSKKLAPKLILSILKLLQKCKIIKDYNKPFTKVMHFVLEYQRCIKYYASSFWTLITAFVSAYGIYLCKALIAFFIYCTFKGLDTSVFTEIFAKVILCELAVKLIPLPGGSGLSEISFTAMFASLFDNGSIFWALLIWKILDYFIYLIQGGVVLIYDFVYGNRRYAKFKEKHKDLVIDDYKSDFNKMLELPNEDNNMDE